MLKNTSMTYGSVSKCLHWIIALLVIIMLCVGFFLDKFPESMQGTAYMLHKSTGLLILGLMVVRVIWAVMNKVPMYSDSMPRWQQIAARSVHGIFYVLLLAMPLDGWIMSTADGRSPSFFGLITLPFPGIEKSETLTNQLANVHEALAYIILTMIVFHTLAALKHHYIDKDNILTRMLPDKK